MKHYKSVEFLSNFRHVSPPYWRLSGNGSGPSCIHDFVQVAISFTCALFLCESRSNIALTFITLFFVLVRYFFSSSTHHLTAWKQSPKSGWYASWQL